MSDQSIVIEMSTLHSGAGNLGLLRVLTVYAIAFFYTICKVCKFLRFVVMY